MKTIQAELHVWEGEKPKFFKPRSVPYAVKESIVEEVDRLEEKGILGKSAHSDWASPIVAVMKPNGNIVSVEIL